MRNLLLFCLRPIFNFRALVYSQWTFRLSCYKILPFLVSPLWAWKIDVWSCSFLAPTLPSLYIQSWSEAIAESLRAEAEFRRYNASATALTDCLESNGFVGLSVDLTRDELLQGYEALTYVEPALASSGTSHFDSSIGSFVIRPIAPVMTVPPTALQFYFDLFGLGDPGNMPITKCS